MNRKMSQKKNKPGMSVTGIGSLMKGRVKSYPEDLDNVYDIT